MTDFPLLHQGSGQVTVTKYVTVTAGAGSSKPTGAAATATSVVGQNLVATGKPSSSATPVASAGTAVSTGSGSGAVVESGENQEDVSNSFERLLFASKLAC